MPNHLKNRRTVQLEDDDVRLTITVEGGHIAEIFSKRTGVNPLWTPPWPSIEPSQYDQKKHPEYGQDSESKLLAGIVGHNLCLDIFGPPSEEEFRAGLTVHGESSVLPYEIESSKSELTARAHLPLAHLDLERRIRLLGEGKIEITEQVKNGLALDRPIAWTEHVTLGDPFIERGVTRLRMPVEQSVTYPEDFGTAQACKADVSFVWPHAPAKDAGTLDLSTYPARGSSSSLTGHLVERQRENAYFQAWNPNLKTAISYAWHRADFPWISLWEENGGRTTPPWNGRTITWGVEFGVSPYAEARRDMIDRGKVFGTPTYRWLPAKTEVRVRYIAAVTACNTEAEFEAGDRQILELL
jgi:hypothetical protein